MTAADLKCRACGARLQPGETLRVTPVDGSPEFVIHRCSLFASCLRAAGHRGQARIETYDPAAADAFDRGQGGASTFAADAASAQRVNAVAATRYARDDGRADG